MNTSQYMDKQIMDLSNSQSHSDLNDLVNPQVDHIIGVGVGVGVGGVSKKEEIEASYDFQPIRPLGSSQPSNIDSTSLPPTRVWTSDSKISSAIRNYGSVDSIEPGKVTLEKERNTYDAALVSEIDRTMKKHADILLHALEGVSARISQLESRTRHIENSVDDLKLSVGNNYGSTDGKIRQLDVILREVHDDVQVVRDKQEMMEAQLQIAKLQVSKPEQQPETQSTAHMDPVQQAASAPMQPHHHLPPVLTQHSTLPPPNAPPPRPLQNLPPLNQYPPHQMPPQRESYFPPPGQTPETPNQQYHHPPPQPHQQAPPQQPYQPPPHPQYPPPPQQHPSQPQPQPQLPLGHHSEETPYVPSSQNYPPSIRPSGPPPFQQFYGTPPNMYDAPPSSRPSSGFSSVYGPSSGASEQDNYSGSSSQYGSGSPLKPQPSSGGGSGYPQIPTARILPQALPTASAVGGGSGSSGTGNRVPIDDVVDKVTNMGFSRDQVRATVRRLTENGQSVDLNVVLDKLMNGGEGQPERAWFGR